MKPLLCDVYKSSKTESLFIYVNRDEGLERVPQELLNRFGEPSLALSLKLSPERKLAKEDPVKVIEAIHRDGFFLQLPPQPERPST